MTVNGDTGYEISKTETPQPKLKTTEKIGLALSPKLREISYHSENLKQAGLDKDTVDTIIAVSIATQKVVDICTNTKFRFGKEFAAKFAINKDDGVIDKKSEPGFIPLKTPVQTLRNFEVVISTSANPNPEWLISQSLENLTGWISLAAEVNPQMVYNLGNEVDYKRFGIKGERTFAVERPRVNKTIVEASFTTIPEAELPERIKKLRDAVTSEFGADLTKRILLCGGTARDVVLGKDPTQPYDGDFDYAVIGDLPEEDHNKLAEVIGKHINNRTDDLTEPHAPYRRAMQEAGAANIKEMLEIDREFSINKFAVNLATGEIIDPHEGVKDLNDGILRLVGKNIDELKINELSSGRKPGEALTLAIRGARFATQYGLKIEEGTIRTFQESMRTNETGNRFAFQFFGPNRAEFQSDIAKGYLKMLEKAQDAQQMIINLSKLGVLHQFVTAIDSLNFQTLATWGVTLRKLGEFYKQKNWKQFIEDSKREEDPFVGIDMRGNKVIEPRQGIAKFFGVAMASARMFSYLTLGV